MDKPPSKDQELQVVVAQLAHKYKWHILQPFTEDHEDALQDILLRAIQAISKGQFTFKSEGETVAWLATIGRNLAIDLGRGKELAPITDIEGQTSLEDHANSIEPIIERRELRGAIKVAIRRLDPKHRAVMERRLDPDKPMSHDEIAQELGITNQTARKRYSDGKAELQRILTDMGWH